MNRSSAMETASMILAVLAAVFIWIIYLSVPLASLSVILALLSRGDRKASGRARSSILLAGGAAFISILITGISFAVIFSNDSLRSQFTEILSYYRSYYFPDEGTPADPQGESGGFSYFDLYGTGSTGHSESEKKSGTDTSPFDDAFSFLYSGGGDPT